jgi:hypothetical protein
MSGSYNHQGSSYSQLMDCLLKDRHQFATEEEFKSFALESVRRFITELRELRIEVSLRPSYLEKSPAHYSSSEKLAG